MKLSIEPTEHFFMAGNVMVRLWQGTDDTARPVVAFVAMVRFDGDLSVTGLTPIPPPDADAQRRWAECILSGEPPGDPAANLFGQIIRHE